MAAAKLRTTRRALLSGAVASAAAMTTGCGGGPLAVGADPPAGTGDRYLGGPVRLSFWNGFTGGDAPVMRSLVEQFNAEHPTITVASNAIRWDEFYRKVPVAVASGDGPDLGVMQIHQLPSAALSGVVVPLDRLAGQFRLSEADFDPAAWRGGVYQNRRYGIPLDVHPLVMYYNEAAFREAGIGTPPQDAAGFDAALGRLRAAGFARPFWMPTLWPAHFMFESLLWQFGGAPFSADATRVTIGGDAGERAIRWMAGIRESGHSPPAVALDSQWNAFRNGTNAIAWDGIWMLGNIADVPGGAGVAPIPRIGDRPAFWANSHNLVIFGRPEPDPGRVQASMVFIRWLSEHSLSWAGAGQLPARNSVRADPGFRAMPVQSALAARLPDARLLPAGPGVGYVQDDTILYALDGALRADDPARDLAEAARLADDQLRVFREQYRR